ncbi:UDP-N-acetylmuramoyl-tripeptide--D-alanyl-D-alanine ligase [soil metagenome]
MKPAPIETVSRILDAEVPAELEAGALVRGGVIDSREVRPGAGQLFFALSGNTDGADFADEAYRNGAVAVVASRTLEVPTLVVKDPHRALQELARWTLEREDAQRPRIVGVTGSVGKTTTKDALAAILRAAGLRVTATESNYNNEIGLPLTLLAAGGNDEALVLEMGATHSGDIAHLCSVAPPEIGVLTAVSPVHLESFGTLEALAAAKGELADSLPESGTLVSPHDAPDGATGRGRTLARRIVFGGEHGSAGESSGLVASEIEGGEEGLSFTVHYERHEARVESPVFGSHLVEPLLAAFGGALALGLNLEDCTRGVSRLKRTGLRGEVYRLRDGIVVYDDSYNASPAANEAVLRHGAEAVRAGGGRLVAVLGGMFELGVGAREYHREIGALATELGVDLLICVGDEARWYAEGFSDEAIIYGDAAAAGEGLKDSLKGGEYVVIKGSRGVGLEVVSRRLREDLALV